MATAIETAILFALLARRVPEISVPRIAATAAQCALAAVVMAAALWAGIQVAGDGAAATLLAVPTGALVYFGAAYALGNQEVRQAAARVQRRVSRI